MAHSITIAYIHPKGDNPGLDGDGDEETCETELEIELEYEPADPSVGMLWGGWSQVQEPPDTCPDCGRHYTQKDFQEIEKLVEKRTADYNPYD